MKRISIIIMTFCFLGVMATTAAAQCGRFGASTVQCRYYEAGYRSGADDARDNRGSDYRRHRDSYTRQYETAFREGYDDGYRLGAQGGGLGTDSLLVRNYGAGYRFGQQDREQRRGRQASRWWSQANVEYRQVFQNGYNDGYDRRSPRYDISGLPQIPGDPGPSYPAPGYPGAGYPGFGSGATWSGRVDNRVHVIIQGNNIRSEDLTYSGLQVHSEQMNGALPRSQTNVSVIKRAGRGTARVVQQPNRRNGFAAIIEISDPSGGSDDYQLEISWGGRGWGDEGDWNTTYGRGRVTWRGRVDRTANVAVRNRGVWAEATSGEALYNDSYDIDGFLGRRAGTVRVRKLSGRGSVRVTQQPSSRNNYTAMVEIFDSQGGADDYEIEITW